MNPTTVNMKVYYDIIEVQDIIKQCLKKYGCHPEHNFEHYQAWADEHDECVFFDFGAHQGILTHWHPQPRSWTMFTEPLTSPKKKLKFFWQFVDYIFERKKAKKLHLETSLEFRKALIENSYRYKIRSVNEIFYWPVFDMKNWDGDKMAGKSWKRLRNTLHKFYKEHQVEFVDSRAVDKEKLKQVVRDWLSKREAGDRGWIDYFIHIVDNNFAGFENCITVLVDGEPCSITAGWLQLHSDCYYSGVGLTNYKYEGLGEVANLDDLQRCKKKGYNYVDFGGGGKALTAFKSKFKPSDIYKTYNYVLAKK